MNGQPDAILRIYVPSVARNGVLNVLCIGLAILWLIIRLSSTVKTTEFTSRLNED